MQLLQFKNINTLKDETMSYRSVIHSNHLTMSQFLSQMELSERRKILLFLRTGKSTKVNGTKKVKDMEEVFKHGWMVQFTRGTGRLIERMVGVV